MQAFSHDRIWVLYESVKSACVTRWEPVAIGDDQTRKIRLVEQQSEIPCPLISGRVVAMLLARVLFTRPEAPALCPLSLGKRAQVLR